MSCKPECYTKILSPSINTKVTVTRESRKQSAIRKEGNFAVSGSLFGSKFPVFYLICIIYCADG